MRAVLYASSAVNTELIYNMSLSVMYPDRLGRAVLNAVDTALTGGFFQADRTHKFIFIQMTVSFPLLNYTASRRKFPHGRRRSQIHLHGDGCAFPDYSVNLHLIGKTFHIRQSHTGAEAK